MSINNSNTPVYNMYADLPPRVKVNERNKEYIQLITNMGAEMFDISDMSHDYSTQLLRTIMLYGSAYLKKADNGKYIICGGQFVGIPEPENIYPEKYLAVKTNFKFEGIPDETKGETVVYLTPQLDLTNIVYRYATQFSEIDTSLVNNIQFARIAPIGVVGNERIKDMYEKALGKMLTGDLVNSILTPLSLTTNEPANITTMDISNADYSGKIQYLSMYHEQMISRLSKLMGIKYNFYSKQANITNDELHNSDDFSCIYPLMFKKFLNLCLNKIGLTAEFSEPWKWIDAINADRYNRDDDDNTEDDADEAEKETDSETTETETDSTTKTTETETTTKE